MSAETPTLGLLLESREGLRPLIDGWVENLAEVLETMTAQRPQANWRKAPSGAEEEAAPIPAADVLWWKQPLSVSADAVIWVGSPRPSWEFAGDLTLKASGLEGAPEGESQKTWLEILNQWLSALARSIASLCEQQVACSAGAAEAPPEAPSEWIEVSLGFGDSVLPPLAVSFSAALRTLLAAPAPAEPAPAAEPDAEEKPAAKPASRTMDLLLDVDLPVSISFGKTQLPLKDLIKLTTGSIVELNRGVSEPVDVLVNHYLVARGEVVVVDGNYGVRIRQIVNREDRLRALR